MDASTTAARAPSRSNLTPLLLGSSAVASTVTAALYASGFAAFERWWSSPLAGPGTASWQEWRLVDAAATSFELTAAVAWLGAVVAIAAAVRSRTTPTARSSRGRARWWLSLTAAAAVAIAVGHLAQPAVDQLSDPGAIRFGYGLRVVGHCVTALAMGLAGVVLRTPPGRSHYRFAVAAAPA